MVLTALVCCLIIATGCVPAEDTGADETMVLTSAADTLAHLAGTAAGREGWRKVPYVRFDFAVERGGERTLRRRHLWDRRTGDYRLEVPIGADSVQVVLFNTNTRQGEAYINGGRLSAEDEAAALERAWGSHLNDVYWLAMPMKLFDEGVMRGVDPDSAAAAKERGQDLSFLTLSFDGVGLTPGDRYWIGIDSDGIVRTWSYLLQRSDTPRTYRWVDYVEMDSEAGAVRLASRKQASGFAILTDNLVLTGDFDAAHFTSAASMLK